MKETLQNRTVKLDQSLLDELEVVQMEYFERKGFPDGYCIEVSRGIAYDYGLRYQEGFLILDFPDKKGSLLVAHAWCKDIQGIIIDLTAYQFNAKLKKPLSRCVEVVRPENPFYKRYLPLK